MVPTGSMEGTILVGDHILLNKLPYAPRVPWLGVRLPRLRAVKPGEIVAFWYPRNPSEAFIKRVVAVGGDTIEVRNNVVLRNGVAQREPYAVFTAPGAQAGSGVFSLGANFGPMVVPQGQLFVMGDNRDNSDDSRYWGTVPVENVIGEPLVVFWSYDVPSAAWLDERPAQQLKLYTWLAAHLFERTRWARIGVRL